MQLSSLASRASLLAFVLVACGEGPPPDAPKSAPPPAPRAASLAPPTNRDRAPEPAFEKVEADTEKKTSAGATMFVPKGWFVKTMADKIALEEPDRELAVTIVEVSADTTEAAIAKAWERLGKKAPAKVEHTDTQKDVAGWDEVTETIWETPAADGKVLAMNARRKDKRAWIFVVDAKKAALGRRGAQLRQVIGGLNAPGVSDEDLSKNAVVALDAERAKTFETFIETMRAKTQVPGAAVAVVHDGKIVFEKGFGTKEATKKDPVTPKTKFMIGSVTKSLSSLLIAKLVDEGKVKWETPVKELFARSGLSFETGDPAFTEKLSLWHTFCACTGMPRKDLDFIFEYAKVKPENTLSWFAKTKPTTGFGETFQYSNQMTALGGFLAARVAEPNKPLSVAYETAMKTRLFEPMGMNDTTASFDEGRKGNVASPHSETLTKAYGEPHAIPFAMESFVVPVAPAGAVFSTAHDMARYALVELGNGKTPEGKEVVSSANLLERRKPRVKTSAKGSYGLGLVIANWTGLQAVTHDGGTFGFVTRFFLVPDKKIGLVVLTSSTGMGKALADATTQRLLELMLGAKERASTDLDHEMEQGKVDLKKLVDRMTMPYPEGLAARVTGTWQTDRLGTVVIAADPKDPKVLRADAGEWSSRLGYGKADDGTERLFLLDPPLPTIGFRMDKQELVVEYGQDTFRFAKK
jgi:CubicO group peptidase (beta-lactamase class C family)